MPQTWSSVGIRVQSLVISLAQDNTIQELRANASVNYGTWGRGEQVDMLSDLTVAERSSLDALVARLTRKLQQEYETPAFWTPQISDTFLWLDGASESGGNLKDKKGISLTRTASSTGNLVVTPNDLGGLPTLSFPGTVVVESPVLPYLAQEKTFHVLAIVRMAAVQQAVLFHQSPGGAERVLWHPAWSNNLTYWDVVNATTGRLEVTTPFADKKWHIVALGRTGRSQFIRDNGSEIASRTLTGSPTARQSVLGMGAGATFDLAEFIITTGNIGVPGIERYEGYLAWRYGLTGSLPVDHPYKTKRP